MQYPCAIDLTTTAFGLYNSIAPATVTGVCQNVPMIVHGGG